jgi:Chaperone of endosialidase
MANPQIRIIQLPLTNTAVIQGTNIDYLPIESSNAGGRRISVNDFFNNVGSNYFYPIVSNFSGNARDIVTFTTGGSGFQDNPGTQIDGNAIIYATGFQSQSSERYKTNIRPLEYSLACVQQLQSVRFDWIEKPITNDIGLIAEQVNLIIPEAVGKGPVGECESIDYSKLVPVLINAIKELTLRVQALEAKS